LAHEQAVKSAVLSAGVSEVKPVYPGALGWHVVLVTDRDILNFPNHYCYLRCVKFKYHSAARTRLGPWPSFGEILNCDSEWFPGYAALDKHVVYTDNETGSVTNVRGMSALDALVGALFSVGKPYVVRGSLGDRLRTSHADHKVVDPPSINDKLGGVGKKRAVEPVRFQKLVKHGPHIPYSHPLAQRVAELVFQRAMCDWGLRSDSEAVVLDALVQLCVGGTSSSIPPDARRFVHGGVWRDLRPLYAALNYYVGVRNAFRMWVRSFRKSLLCFMMRDFLKDPDNVVERTRAVCSYGVPFEVVHMAFDCSRELSNVAGLDVRDRVVLRVVRARKFSPSLYHVTDGVVDLFRAGGR